MANDQKERQQDPSIFIPLDVEIALLMDAVGWGHRWNTMIKAREWRTPRGVWVPDDPRVQAQVRNALRSVGGKAAQTLHAEIISLAHDDLKDEDDNKRPPFTPRMVAMRSNWGEVLAVMDGYEEQQYNPIEFIHPREVSGDPPPELMPWISLLQRRMHPKLVWQPPIIIKPDQELLPPDLEYYTDTLFYTIPIYIQEPTPAVRRKYHNKNRPVLVFTSDEGLVLPDPADGLARARAHLQQNPKYKYAEAAPAPDTTDAEAENIADRIAAQELDGTMGEMFTMINVNPSKRVSDLVAAKLRIRGYDRTNKGKWRKA